MLCLTHDAHQGDACERQPKEPKGANDDDDNGTAKHYEACQLMLSNASELPTFWQVKVVFEADAVPLLRQRAAFVMRAHIKTGAALHTSWRSRLLSRGLDQNPELADVMCDASLASSR